MTASEENGIQRTLGRMEATIKEQHRATCQRFDSLDTKVESLDKNGCLLGQSTRNRLDALESKPVDEMSFGPLRAKGERAVKWMERVVYIVCLIWIILILKGKDPVVIARGIADNVDVAEASEQ